MTISGKLISKILQVREDVIIYLKLKTIAHDKHYLKKAVKIKLINYKSTIAFILSILFTNLSANINGIKIEIVEAHEYGKVHIPLVDKRINANTDMFRLGYMQAGKSTQKVINKSDFYIITIQDKYSKGKLNAIIKGDHLKRRPHHVGVLTQATFLLARDLLGDKYNKSTLENKLNKIAKKIIKRKGFVLDNNLEIDYTDILLYTDESRVLYKPFDEYVKPLETKIKNNTFTYKDAYSFVYDPYHRTVPKKKNEKDSIKKVIPLYRLVRFIHIPQNTNIGTEIETLEQLRVGSAKVDGFEILGSSMPFRISQKGTVTVSLPLTKEHYSFRAIAHTKDGDSNKIEFTIIIDDLEDKKFYKVSK